MTTIKPKLPTITPDQLGKSVDKLAGAIEESKAADGSVDVARVEEKIAGDVGASDAFDEVKRAHADREVRRVTSGCSGTVTMQEIDVDPKQLESSEVQSVMNALLEAKSRLAGRDKNDDGKLSHAELRQGSYGDGLAGQVAYQVADAAVTPFERELNGWRTAVTDVLVTLESRQGYDAAMGKTAAHHAATPEGKDAILWAYRDLLTQGKGADIWKLEGDLRGAETSFLKHLPFFGKKVEDKQGHLNDKEVARFLGTNDLASFAADKKATVESRVGGDYDATYLAGKDLAGIEATKDPDFVRVSSGC